MKKDFKLLLDNMQDFFDRLSYEAPLKKGEIKIIGKVTIEKKRITRFENMEKEPAVKAVLPNRLGRLAFDKKGGYKIILNRISGDFFLNETIETVEIFVDKVKKEKKSSDKAIENTSAKETIEISPDKYAVTFCYHGYDRVFNSTLLLGEESQWTLVDDTERTNGFFEAKSIKSNMTEKGGTLEVDFTSVVGALWLSKCKMIVEIELDSDFAKKES